MANRNSYTPSLLYTLGSQPQINLQAVRYWT